MSFSDFYGNDETVHRLRDMLARERFPHAVILSGAQGSGKYTWALMLAQALYCLNPKQTGGRPDFRGQCELHPHRASGSFRGALRRSGRGARGAARDRQEKETRLFVQTHPDVLIIPPDPPQMLIKVDQVRRVIETIYYRPAEEKSEFTFSPTRPS